MNHGFSPTGPASGMIPDCPAPIMIKETRSVNDDLRALCLEGAPHGTSVIAEVQTAGRGRMGRVFASPAGGLYLSFLVRGESASDPVRLTVTAAVAAAEAIERTTGLSVGIKWVNDLYLDGKKVAGILAEGILSPDTGELLGAAVGIGVNVIGALPEELSPIAVTLRDAMGRLPDIAALQNALLLGLWDGFLPDTPLPIDEYRDRSVLTDKTVTVHRGDETFSARVLGITGDGGLSVLPERPGASPTVLSWGEVTLHSL